MRLAYLSIGRHIHTERWIQWFAQRGHECHLLTVQPGHVEGVTVHDIACSGPGKAFRYGRSLRLVKDVLRRLKPDLLNTHFLTGYGYWGHFSRFHPNVLTVWGDDIYVTPFENPLKRWLARRALSSCDALTGDSIDVLDMACRRLGADPHRAFRVLWGVDLQRFAPAADSSFRDRLGFTADDVVYLSPRSYTQAYYNIDIIIEAAAIVRRSEPRARFLFCGYEGDPAPFEARTRESGLDGVVKVLGRIAHEEFADVLNAGDVFISVPSVDATAVSLLEAMSCQRAVIVSALPSAMEWVKDGVTGSVVPPRDVRGLAAAMLAYARDPSRRRAHGKAARETALGSFDFDSNMRHVDAIYRRLVSKDDDWPREVALTTLQHGGGAR
jgi:L-malate glycosyltransferase